MTEQAVLLMRLMDEGKTCNEICSILNISQNTLYQQLLDLKNKGLFYQREYYANGKITYQKICSMSDLPSYTKNRGATLFTNFQQSSLKVLLISDLHFGNKLERMDLLDQAFEYCIKNDIHVILCGGDIIDGTFTKYSENQYLKRIYDQIEYFIEHYPADKNILTFAKMGDHDMTAIQQGQCIPEIISNYRHDVVFIGTANKPGKLFIQNDFIVLGHYYSEVKRWPNSKIRIFAHNHKYSTTLDQHEQTGTTLSISIPSLSDINQAFPTVIEMQLNFCSGFISKVKLFQIYFADKPYILSYNNFQFELSINSNRTILNQVDFPNSLKENNQAKCKTLNI